MICLSEKYKTGTLFEVFGRSMEPTLWNGQIVEVMEGYQDGDIIVAEHEGRLIVKRLVGDRLLGDNRALSTNFFVAEVRILGRVEVRTKEELEERGVQLDSLSSGKVLAATLYNDDSPWEFVKKDWYSVVSNRLFSSYSFDPLLNQYNPAGEAKSWNTSNGLDAGEVAYQVWDNTTSIMKYEAIEQGSPYYNIYQKNASKNSVQMGPEWEIVYKRVQPPGATSLDLKPYLADTAYEYRAYASISGLKYYYSQVGLVQPDIPTTPQLINEIPNANVVAGIGNNTDVTITYYIGKKKKNSNPTLTLSTQNNVILSQGTVTLSGNVIDPDGDTVTVSATIAGIQKQTTVPGTGSWLLSWPVADLPQGQYSNIVITATDGKGGTATATYTGMVTIDKTKPSIAISGVSEGQTYTSATPVFSATDAGGAGLQSCTATLNGNAFTSGTQITVGGSYTLIVTAKDNAGNVSTQTINFKVNSAPTIEITTANNQTLYEGDSLIISGSANDANVGNALIVKLKIDEEPERNILVTTSTGTPQPISYTVTFKNGRLYDASNNPITPELNKDVVHSFTVYAKDDSGAESSRIVRQFMVVPNRNPLISVNLLQPLSGMVPTDTFSISGTVNDPDEGNTVTMEYKLNQEPFQLATMEGETWSFSIFVGDLRDGENIVELKALDNKGGVTVKRMAIDQTPRIVPVKVSQSRYMILPPKGEMKGLVAWIQRKKGDLQVKGDLSIVATGQPESFVPMEKTSAELSHALDEDQFIGSVETAGQNVTIKLTETRADALNSSAAITKIAGVIN
ncbi:S24/S26 family peptidase [Aneurinibacillus migulanus]|uniref:S24/S26 family peptidase n=2 Tax=Aneurinibacillus migulanus TaxID=47500 RepID=UPI0005B789C3|nr:S24/S26 family peptidase [Aneurinibacillus migulanus]KIV55064.1 hypothetical protein TS64_12370 [Aneurinibacillus migulanus]CEH29489.1 Peptidase S24-like protein [Aneurinibacillus migulanus]